MALVAHYATPSPGASISPLFTLTGGGGGVIEELRKAAVAKITGYRCDSEELTFWKRTISVHETRARIVAFGSHRAISKCLQKHDLADSDEYFADEEMAGIWIRKSKVRRAPFGRYWIHGEQRR